MNSTLNSGQITEQFHIIPKPAVMKGILGPGVPYKITFPTTRKVKRWCLALCCMSGCHPSGKCAIQFQIQNQISWAKQKTSQPFGRSTPFQYQGLIKGPSGGLFIEIPLYTTKKCNTIICFFVVSGFHTA